MNQKQYVLGFILCLEENSVLLIKKKRPDFQAGFLNGLGGKIEPNESVHAALTREIKEECGIETDAIDWNHFCNMECRGKSIDGVSDSWLVMCFVIDLPADKFYSQAKRRDEEDEELVEWLISEINVLHSPPLLGNIPWLVSMAIDKIKNKAFVAPDILYTGLSLPLFATGQSLFKDNEKV